MSFLLGLFFLVVFLLVLLALALERGAQNIAERRAGIGGTVLRNRLLLLGDFQRFNRDRDLVGTAIELDDAGVDLLSGREAVGTLFGTVARQF